MTHKSRSPMFSSTVQRAGIAVVFAAAVVVFALFASSAQQRQKPERLETELITLQPSGFEPNEIRRPQSAFILGVDNRSGVEAVELQFMRADGQRLNALQTPKRRVSWREVVDLAPGEYLLSVANQPEWTCRVTILPR